MKKFALASMLVLFAITMASPWLVSASSSGRSASGVYRFTLDDDLTKSLEFNAATDERGATTGHMVFADETRIGEQDVDGAGAGDEREPPAFFMEADLDTLTIENNRAVMSGLVRSSSREN